MTAIAVVGLGAMGSRIAQRLLSADHEIILCNRTPAKLTPLIDLGATGHRAADHVRPHNGLPEVEVVSRAHGLTSPFSSCATTGTGSAAVTGQRPGKGAG